MRRQEEEAEISEELEDLSVLVLSTDVVGSVKLLLEVEMKELEVGSKVSEVVVKNPQVVVLNPVKSCCFELKYSNYYS